MLFFAGLAFNRHRQLLRSYAEVEQKVAQRTQELEIANRQLLHSQKMNALGALAAGIAHDFNNILSIIKGSAQIIEDNLDDPEKVRTRVDRIKTVVEQGAGIVKAMLGFSRESAEPPAPCDLNAVLDDTVKLLGDRFLREVQVTLERAPALPEVTCSKDFIQQVLLNFILNAAESMDQAQADRPGHAAAGQACQQARCWPRRRPPVMSPSPFGTSGAASRPTTCPASSSRSSPPKPSPPGAAPAWASRWSMSWPRKWKPASPSKPSWTRAAPSPSSCRSCDGHTA